MGAEAGLCHLWHLIHREHRAPFAHGRSGFQPSSPRPSRLSEKGGAAPTFTERDDTPSHRWIDCSFTGFLCGTSTQNDAVTASCVGFNTYNISCPYLWFARDYIVHKPSLTLVVTFSFATSNHEAMPWAKQDLGIFWWALLTVFWLIVYKIVLTLFRNQ